MEKIIKGIKKKLKQFDRRLNKIDQDWINQGILTIPEGITIIDKNLQYLLEKSGIILDINVVILPKSLKKMGNFLSHSKVKLAVFYSPVSLFNVYNEGAFENSSIEEVIIYQGFSSIEQNTFKGLNASYYSIGDNQYKVIKRVDGNEAFDVMGAFFNCLHLHKLTVIGDSNEDYITTIYNASSGTKSYHHLIKNGYRDQARLIFMKPPTINIPLSQASSYISEQVHSYTLEYKNCSDHSKGVVKRYQPRQVYNYGKF